MVLSSYCSLKSISQIAKTCAIFSSCTRSTNRHHGHDLGASSLHRYILGDLDVRSR